MSTLRFQVLQAAGNRKPVKVEELDEKVGHLWFKCI